jgi:hypothetical protein
VLPPGPIGEGLDRHLTADWLDFIADYKRSARDDREIITGYILLGLGPDFPTFFRAT